MARTAAVVLTALALAGGAAATSSPPTLKLVARTPTVVVHGSGFRARERVTVTAASAIVRLRATRLGSFTVNTGLSLSRCTGMIVRAVGASGRAAVLKLPQPACMPAANP